MLGEIRGEVRFKEPLSFHTSLRIGGPADIFVVPQDIEDVRLALGFAERDHLPVEIIGGGNNLLVCDRGIRGVVIKVEGCLGRAEFHGEEAVAGAGVGLSALIREAAALNLGGIECLVGIPATAGSVLVGARLQLHRRPQAEIQKDMKQRLKVKKATQPLALASVGCVWKNPHGENAGRLIEKVGLKGKRLNGAEISAKHANFIVNRGGANAGDITALMDMTRERVQGQFGISLEPEIRIMGEE